MEIENKILIFGIISVLLLSLLATPIFAADTATSNQGLIQMLQQKIADLIKQITDLIRQMTQQQTANVSESVMQQNYQPAENSTQNTSTVDTSIQSNNQTYNNSTKVDISSQSSSPGSSGQATLTVNVTGATAYVSINHGTKFAYSGPIALNNGDTYSVTVSQNTSSGSNTSSSNTTCSGTASSGGAYYCNISVQ
jgi:hypothetical protein